MNGLGHAMDGATKKETKFYDCGKFCSSGAISLSCLCTLNDLVTFMSRTLLFLYVLKYSSMEVKKILVCNRTWYIHILPSHLNYYLGNDMDFASRMWHQTRRFLIYQFTNFPFLYKQCAFSTDCLVIMNIDGLKLDTTGYLLHKKSFPNE